MSAAAEVMFNNELTTSDVSITDSAAVKLAELLKEAGSDLQGVRIYVSGGGCGGMQYGMTFSEDASQYDAVLTGKGFDLYIDTVAISFIRGIEIDYVENKTGANFVFNNVFASTGGSGACGACGAQTGPGGGGCG